MFSVRWHYPRPFLAGSLIAIACIFSAPTFAQALILADGETPPTEPILLQSTIRTPNRPMRILIEEHLLLQVEQHSEFRIEPVSADEIKILMGKGRANLVHLTNGKTLPLNAGSWLIRLNQMTGDMPSSEHPATSANNDTTEDTYRQSYHFDDYIYLRQQAYLESIKIPLSTFTGAVISILGGRR